jgi:hypothetical protein
VADVKWKGSHITEANLAPANFFWRGNGKEMKKLLAIKGSKKWQRCQPLTQDLTSFNFTPRWMTTEMILVRDEYQESIKAGVPFSGEADPANQFWYFNWMGDLLFIPPAKT